MISILILICRQALIPMYTAQSTEPGKDPVLCISPVGQPVLGQFAAAAKGVEPEPARMTEMDKHFARKEAKMQRKLAKVSAKLETLRFKHGIAASR